MLYHPGDFPDGNSAWRYCESIGRTDPNDCGGRYLSRDAGDKTLYCTSRDPGPTCTLPEDVG